MTSTPGDDPTAERRGRDGRDGLAGLTGKTGDVGQTGPVGPRGVVGPELLAATQALADKVKSLTDTLSVSQDQANRTERQAQRTKSLTRWVLVLTLISLAGVFFTATLLSQVRDTVETNRANAVIACQNANEQRAANHTLWTFVLAASAANNEEEGEEQSPAEQRLSEDFRVWIAELYAPRDCSDLSKKYEIPPPPTLGD